MVPEHHLNKIITAFILFCAVVAVQAQGTWERVSVPITQDLNSVCFVDSLYGWVAGDSGIIFRTVDGGSTWLRQETNSTYDVEEVFFLNRNLGWASTFNFTTVPYGTILLKTTNGGVTWVSQPYPTEDIFITCILFRDSLNGWMGGQPHALVRTTDGGNNWAQAAIDTSTLAFFPVLSIQFYNDQYGYASGGRFDIAGVTWRTLNGGDMWYAIDPSQAPADEVHSLYIFDSLHVMGSGGDPDFGYGVGMIRTADGGLNWSYEETTIQGNAYDLDFRNSTEVWAPLGPGRKFIYSLDAGTTWAPVPTPDLTAIYDVTFPDSLHGCAVGRFGAILKYHPPVIPAVPSVLSLQKGYILYQNTPNPVQGSTSIRFTVPSANFSSVQSTLPIQLKVFDVYGKEVASLVNGPLPGGDHEVKFDATGLPGGIYIYQLQVLTATQSLVVAGPEKMIILPPK